MASSTQTPVTAPKRMPLLTALMGENASNTGTPVSADRPSTARAIHSFAWRGTGISRTSMRSLRRAKSTISRSRFTGHTHPQNARPRISPYTMSTGSAASSQSSSNVLEAAMTCRAPKGSRMSRPPMDEEDRLPKKGSWAGVAAASSPPTDVPNRLHPAASTGAANSTRAAACTAWRSQDQRNARRVSEASLIAYRPRPAWDRPRS